MADIDFTKPLYDVLRCLMMTVQSSRAIIRTSARFAKKQAHLITFHDQPPRNRRQCVRLSALLP